MRTLLKRVKRWLWEQAPIRRKRLHELIDNERKRHFKIEKRITDKAHEAIEREARLAKDFVKKVTNIRYQHGTPYHYTVCVDFDSRILQGSPVREEIDWVAAKIGNEVKQEISRTKFEKPPSHPGQAGGLS